MIFSEITSRVSFSSIIKIRSLTKKDFNFTMQFLKRYKKQVLI